jgi:predicted nucleic-acid-binding Zn-ribbon protein
MPIESDLLAREPYAKERCPKCGAICPEFMRGQVQRSKRFLWVLWKRPYCAVICHRCKCIIGWESPPSLEVPAQPTTRKGRKPAEGR